MRTFLLRSALFLVCALIITVGIFIWLNSSTMLPALSQQVQTFKSEPVVDQTVAIPDEVIVAGIDGLSDGMPVRTVAQVDVYSGAKSAPAGAAADAHAPSADKK